MSYQALMNTIPVFHAYFDTGCIPTLPTEYQIYIVKCEKFIAPLDLDVNTLAIQHNGILQVFPERIHKSITEYIQEKCTELIFAQYSDGSGNDLVYRDGGFYKLK